MYVYIFICIYTCFFFLFVLFLFCVPPPSHPARSGVEGSAWGVEGSRFRCGKAAHKKHLKRLVRRRRAACKKRSKRLVHKITSRTPPVSGSETGTGVGKRRLAPESNEATCGAVAQHASGTCTSSKQSGVPARNLILCLSQNWHWTRLPMVIKYLSIGRIFSFFSVWVTISITNVDSPSRS